LQAELDKKNYDMKAGIGATAKGKDNEKDDYDDL